MRVILASGSPRRKELLAKIFKDYEVVAANINERKIEDEIKKENEGMDVQELAGALVSQLSMEKAAAVFTSLSKPRDCIVIGADTAVALPDEILGKPADREDAVRMLRKQSITPQQVITGVTIIKRDAKGNINFKAFKETSVVIFNKLDDEQEARIQAYVDTDEPYDKAGGYGIQALGDQLVDRYEGDFNNIIGLPVDRLEEELKNF